MSNIERALEYLAAHPGQPVSVADLKRILGVTSPAAKSRLGTDVANSIRKASPKSRWRNVTRVDYGVYVYQSDNPEPARPWSEVATDPSGLVVLRSPDGSLYVAKAVK